MNAQDLVGLLPIIVIAGASVVLMLTISVRRDYQLAWWVALVGLLLSMVTVTIAWNTVPIQVTPLIIIDQYALFFTTLLIASGALVLVFCYDYFKSREGTNEELFLLILTALLGGVVLVSSSHFASFFIGLEILSVSLFALIAYPIKQRRCLEAAIKYLILSGVSSAFLLFGMALIYAAIGTLSFDQMGKLLATVTNQPYSFTGIIMLVIALGFKLSLVPFHMWTSDVYEGAPVPVTAFVAIVSKGAIFGLLLRFFVQTDAYIYDGLYPIICVIAIVTIIGGNLLALLQTNIKRILAYSSIAHMGYLLVAFVAGMFVGVDLVIESVVFYLITYIITTLGAFGVVTALSSSEKEAEMLDDYTGLFWNRPWVAILFTVMLLSLAGIPLTAGFIGKFYIFAAGVDSQLWMLLLVVVAGSGIGLFYYLRIVLQMAKQPVSQAADGFQIVQPSAAEGVALCLLTVLVFWFGIQPNDLMEMIMGVSRGGLG